MNNNPETKLASLKNKLRRRVSETWWAAIRASNHTEFLALHATQLTDSHVTTLIEQIKLENDTTLDLINATLETKRQLRDYQAELAANKISAQEEPCEPKRKN